MTCFAFGRYAFNVFFAVVYTVFYATITQYIINNKFLVSSKCFDIYKDIIKDVCAESYKSTADCVQDVLVWNENTIYQIKMKKNV
jgi:hypothetical protein